MTIGITELPPEGMQLGGVALAGDSAKGTRTTEGLSLLFTTAGITVQGPQPQIERLLVWSGLDSATCNEKLILPDGRNASVMELTSGGQSIRFLLPTDTVSPGQAAYLDQALPAWLARYRAAEESTLGMARNVNLAERPDPATTASPAPPSSRRPAAAGTAATGPTAGAGAGPGAKSGPSSSATGTLNGIGSGGSAPNASTAASAPPPPPPPPPSPPPPAPTAPSPAAAAPASPSPGPGPTPPAPLSADRPLPPAPSSRAAAPPPPTPAPPSSPSAGPPPPSAAPPSPPPAGSTPATPPSPATAGSTPATPPSPPKAGSTPATPPSPLRPSAGPPSSPPPGSTPVGGAPSPAPRASAPSAGPAPPVPPSVPPPPPTPGPVTWVLSVDPMEPGSEWDNPPLGEPLLEDIPAPKRRWGRRKAKTVAATAAVGTAVGVGESAAVRDVTPPTSPPSPTSPSSATGTITPPAAEPAEPASDVAASAPAAVATPAVEKSAAAPTATGKGAPTTDAPPPPAAPVSTDAVGDEPKGPPQTKEPADSEQAAPTPERPRRRSRLVVLGVALLAVIGAIGYLVANRNTSSTPTSTSPPPTTLPDAALVASVNLHVADLPAGWTTAGPAAPPLHLPAAPPSAEAQAATTLSSCLSVPTATITGLFAGASLPGQTATGISPTFIQSVGDPGVQMHSVTTTIGAEAQAQSYAAPFQNPDFVACYGQFQRTVAAAAIPGATATVQAVTLPPPAGVKSFGYITTVTSSQGTEVFGQAYMIGGRIVTDLMPATNGPQIPSGDFTHAYDAVGGRIAASVQK